jgi:murein DD-endopeptidase MepM/ murein hydrolase activator NlpD
MKKLVVEVTRLDDNTSKTFEKEFIDGWSLFVFLTIVAPDPRLPALPPGTWRWRAKTMDASGQSDWSEWRTFNIIEGCPTQLEAWMFGLPENNERTSKYGVSRVYRKHKNGKKVETVPDNYVPKKGEEIRTHHGIDFSSHDANGRVTALDFSTPVGGTVVLYPESPWNTIGVRIGNGRVIQFLHASAVYVRNGAPVTPGTVLGRTGSTGADDIHLHVQVRDKKGRILDPDHAITTAMCR